MKLINLFRDFLRDTVNLNQTRIDDLQASVEALKTFVRDSDWAPRIAGFEEQGSWAHDTIIKPVNGGEFDADLLVLVRPVDGWSAADYVTTLGAIFQDSATYADKVKVWDYCATIAYAGDRKIDLAPCVVGRLWEDSLEVCNRGTGQFERTEPVAYTKWIHERNGYSGSNSFRKATRLLKYLRDIKRTFTCPSVLLTTLIGQRISYLDKDSAEFADTPTTLQTIVGRLDDWLQMNQSRPSVENPSLPGENFGDLWTDAQYMNFRDLIHKYHAWIDDAVSAEDRVDSIKAWRKIFGDDFAKGAELRTAVSIAEGVTKAHQFLMSTAAHLDGLVDVVRNWGISVLPHGFNRPSHMHQPPWPSSPQSVAVQVSATWQSSQHNTSRSRVVRAGEILAPRGGLWFEVHTNGMRGVPQNCSVHWRITNTGVVAFAKHAQRGGFYTPQGATSRWETLEYRGVHIAEAFVVRDSDNRLIGVSAPFNVIIE